ncbi:hypothetical protein CU098_005161, partial [Rhizopus stolonifer]
HQLTTPVTIFSKLSAPKISDIRSTISTSEKPDISNIGTSDKIAEATQAETVNSEQTNKVIELLNTTDLPVLNSPSKRRFSTFTPPLFPADYRPRPTPIQPQSAMPTDSQNFPDLNLDSALTFDFGEMSSPAQTTENEANFFSSGTTFDWIAKFEQRLRQYEQRLSQIENLTEENSRLRAELSTANRKIEELEKKEPVSEHFPILEQPTKPFQGTEASRHATVKTVVEPPQEPHRTIPRSFASAAIKGKSAPPPLKTSKNKRTRRVTPRPYQAITRTFTATSATSGYKYLYLPCRFREPISSLRAKLKKLKIDNSRILDVHYPDNQVIALLAHNDYINEIVQVFSKAGVKPVEEFNPLDEQRLRNPAFAALDKEARKSKCVELHHARLLRALSFIRESIRPAVARDFRRKNWITDDQFKSSLGKDPAVSSPGDTPADKTDTDMPDVIDTFCPTSPASSNSLTGAGEPVEEL